MEKEMRNFFEITLLIVLLAATLSAQPTVNPDLSVSFKLKAPQAKQVYFGSEAFAFAPPGALMTPSDDGTWTITTPPLEPGWYPYGFIVDGLFVVDPNNSNVRPQLTPGNPLNNILVVPGPTPAVYMTTIPPRPREPSTLKRSTP
jgi:hypothetical protein